MTQEQSKSKTYWRSLDELSEKPAFKDWMEREFPAAASELPSKVSRRRWLQLMGASLALGGMTGCRWETEQFAPFTVRPQNRTPGEKQFFATGWELDGVARPLAVTSFDGRPIKVEGNALHPFTSGGTDAFDQASILSLYDPDRSSGLIERVSNELAPRAWNDFDSMLGEQLRRFDGTQGDGLAIICRPTSSPTRQRLRKMVKARFPKMEWCESAPSSFQNAAAGARMAFGDAVREHVNFEQARVIVCIDADPMGSHPAAMKSIRQWADRRNPDGDWVNRLYAFESDVSLTGSNADHRIAVRSTDLPLVVEALESLIATGTSAPRGDDDKLWKTISAAADDLLKNKGRCVVLAGANQPPEIHVRLHRLNAVLGNVDSVVQYTAEPAVDEGSTTFVSLVNRMEQKQIQCLMVLDENPAYGDPTSQRFRSAVANVDLAIHAGLYRNETAELCHWHIPLAHPLESWDDARAWDGTVTLSQPLIAPLFSGRTTAELMSGLTRIGPADGQKLVRQTYTTSPNAANSAGADIVRIRTDADWRRAIHDGFVSDSQFAKRNVSLSAELDSRLPVDPASISAIRSKLRSVEAEASALEVIIRTDASVHDGRFANNGWLQETPDPITKLTWGNAAVMSPETARSIGVDHEQLIRLSRQKASVELPVFVMPGIATGSIQLARGYGRTRAGHVGGLTEEDVAPIGVDVTPLMVDGKAVLSDVSIKKLSGSRKLATTQDHFAIDVAGLEAIGHRVGELVRTGTLTEYEQHPDFAQHRGPHHPPLESPWEEREYDGHAWGMAVDLNRCIGCNACTVACQSENNVPIVGEDQVLAGREMSWLRIDRYFGGDPEDPEFAHQPVACHHCENAPCEQVCPVAATVHSDEGLNDMVYNRCIGTRYCANNCPYKVRRFNFFDYNESLEQPESVLQKMILNPEVTVRSRGVMEKCTYCVQRIQEVKIDAKNDRRPIEDGEIVTACQQACPAQAIVFGDLNDADSAVARAHADGRSYGMLSELNTKPRTKYLAKIRNPHPWLESAVSAPHDSSHSTSQHA